MSPAHGLDIGVTGTDGFRRSGTCDEVTGDASIRLINSVLADDQLAVTNQGTIQESAKANHPQVSISGSTASPPQAHPGDLQQNGRSTHESNLHF